MMAATVCRLEAGAPSRYDVSLDDQRETVALAALVATTADVAY